MKMIKFAPITLTLILASPALAQTKGNGQGQKQDQDNDASGGDIIVTAERLRGAVVGNAKPEAVLSPNDIRATGATSVTDLLQQLGPQLQSTRGGPPIVLVEGRRISSFREIAMLPTEAIARVDILPEQVAIRYGYRAAQKVVNIVLRPRFRVFALEQQGKVLGSGGGSAGKTELDFLRIANGMRLNINAKLELTNQILENQRGINLPTGDSAFRTLSPSGQKFGLNVTYNRKLTNSVDATFNGEVMTDQSKALLGLPFAGSNSPLLRNSSTQSGHFGFTLDGNSAWHWTFTNTYDHNEGRTLTDRTLTLIPTFADVARFKTDVSSTDFLVNGVPFKMPAGDVSTSLKTGLVFNRFETASLRAFAPSSAIVTRRDINGNASIDIPLTSRSEHVMEAIGDLSINGNVAVQNLSDFGTLWRFGYGATWSPIKRLTFNASFTDEQVAPTPQQIGNPQILTANAPAFDFVKGQNVRITQINGGNPGLLPAKEKWFSLGMNVKLSEKPDIGLITNFTRSVTRNEIGSLPGITSAAALAFPTRFTRDGAGNLLSVDSRPVNIDREAISKLRWGINFTKQLQPSKKQIEAMRAMMRARFPNGFPGGPGGGRPGGGPPGGGPPRGGFGGFGGGGGGRGGPGGGFGGVGVMQFSIYHTINFSDTATLAPGLPAINLLEGGTLGNGGTPRHEVQVQANYVKFGIGAGLSGNWQSPTRVIGATGLPADNLRYGSLATVNLRLFANLGGIPQLGFKHPWTRGLRIFMGVNNLFNSRQRITDGNGITPISFQPGYLDPQGRSFVINVRKLFF